MSADTAVLVFIGICMLALVGVIAIIGVIIAFIVQRLDDRREAKVHELSQDEIEEHLRPWAPSVRNGRVKLP